jgi:mutator protein MutT
VPTAAVQVLVTRRSVTAHLPGTWEFPGGKIETGETTIQAVCREIEEEVGLILHDCRELMVVEHEYPDRKVRLHAVVAQVPCGSEIRMPASITGPRSTNCRA